MNQKVSSSIAMIVIAVVIVLAAGAVWLFSEPVNGGNGMQSPFNPEIDPRIPRVDATLP
ncbi:MAG: hypothetical protein KIT45_03785 [Fimbriimonadia bacterium]|nr:hypothetical protein [Fimbriimonadia bacterium]